MDINYLLSEKGFNPDPKEIFKAAFLVNQQDLGIGIRKMPYSEFLISNYWFGVSSHVKLLGKMRCRICPRLDIQTHHRTYSIHGAEHRNLEDLVALCSRCHSLFHRHLTDMELVERGMQCNGDRIKTARELSIIQRQTPPGILTRYIPDGDPIQMTIDLVRQCRTNGSFTSSTKDAFIKILGSAGYGWTQRLACMKIPRAVYEEALDGRFVYGRGKRTYKATPLPVDNLHETQNKQLTPISS